MSKKVSSEIKIGELKKQLAEARQDLERSGRDLDEALEKGLAERKRAVTQLVLAQMPTATYVCALERIVSLEKTVYDLLNQRNSDDANVLFVCPVCLKIHSGTDNDKQSGWRVCPTCGLKHDRWTPKHMMAK